MIFAVMLCMLFSAVLMPAAYASEYDVSVQSEEQVLADGVYYLKKNSSYFTSDLTMKSEKYTSVPDSLTQMWKLCHVGNGHYTIRPMDDLGYCLNGQGMLLQFYSDPVDDIDELSAHSRWVITETTSGYQIKMYTYQWTLAEYAGTTSGSWELEQVTAPPSGVLLKSTQAWIAPKSTATFRAAVYSGSTIDQSVTWSSSNTNVATVSRATGVVTGVSQGTATITAKSKYDTSWQKSFTVNVSFVPNGTYYIKNKASSKVVDIYNSNTNEGESIHHFDFEGTDDQKWIFELHQDGYYTIKSVYSNLYLSVKENSSTSGSEVVQSSGGSADGQRWSISTTSSSAYKLKAKCAGSQDLCLMKGTYIFYPNKLVHMAYTSDTTYDDEWYILNINYVYVNVDVLYDSGYPERFSNISSRINGYMASLNEKYIDLFGINVVATSPSQFSSYCDSNCNASYDSICTHATNDECTNDGTVHHTNIYTILFSLPRPDKSKTLRMAFIGHENCFKNSNGEHVLNFFGGLTIKSYGVATITSYSSSQIELMTVIHEFGHFYGAPDHYGGSAKTTEELEADYPGYGFNDNCIYGGNQHNADVVNNLTICEGCRRIIMQNRELYNH